MNLDTSRCWYYSPTHGYLLLDRSQPEWAKSFVEFNHKVGTNRFRMNSLGVYQRFYVTQRKDMFNNLKLLVERKPHIYTDLMICYRFDDSEDHVLIDTVDRKTRSFSLAAHRLKLVELGTETISDEFDLFPDDHYKSFLENVQISNQYGQHDFFLIACRGENWFQDNRSFFMPYLTGNSLDFKTAITDFYDQKFDHVSAPIEPIIRVGNLLMFKTKSDMAFFRLAVDDIDFKVVNVREIINSAIDHIDDLFKDHRIVYMPLKESNDPVQVK